jgi:hypothetical protein
MCFLGFMSCTHTKRAVPEKILNQSTLKKISEQLHLPGSGRLRLTVGKQSYVARFESFQKNQEWHFTLSAPLQGEELIVLKSLTALNQHSPQALSEDEKTLKQLLVRVSPEISGKISSTSLLHLSRNLYFSLRLLATQNEFRNCDISTQFSRATCTWLGKKYELILPDKDPGMKIVFPSQSPQVSAGALTFLAKQLDTLPDHPKEKFTRLTWVWESPGDEILRWELFYL